MSFEKILITGAAACGKTKGSEFLKEYFKNCGYCVFVDKKTEFKSFEYEKNSDEKVLLIYDGEPEDLSEKTEDFFEFDKYDGVFYLEAKNENDSFYINFWTGHNHFRMIPYSENFDTKLEMLLSEVKSFLGEPIHFEIEKKFLIEYPDINYLNSLKNARAVYISQSYIVVDGVKKRIRKRGVNGKYTYYLTYKKSLDGIKKIETETQLNKEEYDYLMKTHSEKFTIEKTRYCLSENYTYYEIDIYPFWNDKATMEIELKSEDEEYQLPKHIRIIEDVSANKMYSNFNLARNQGI